MAHDDSSGPMKRLLGLVLLAGAAFLAWRGYGGWRAETEVERFVEAWMRGDRVEAAKHGEPAAVEHAMDDRALRGMPGGAAMEAFRGSRCTVESRRRTAGGEVELRVLQTIFFDPPGATTAIGGAMYTNVRHAATVRRTADGWKVAAIEPTYVDMGEVRRGPGHLPVRPGR